MSELEKRIAELELQLERLEKRVSRHGAKLEILDLLGGPPAPDACARLLQETMLELAKTIRELKGLQVKLQEKTREAENLRQELAEARKELVYTRGFNLKKDAPGQHPRGALRFAFANRGPTDPFPEHTRFERTPRWARGFVTRPPSVSIHEAYAKGFAQAEAIAMGAKFD